MTSTRTVTLTETANPSATMTLTLQEEERKKKRVAFTDDTIDNENMGKKKSKGDLAYGNCRLRILMY
jgi:hypothetical protein